MRRILQTRELAEHFGNFLVRQVPNDTSLLQFNARLRSCHIKFMSDFFKRHKRWHILFRRRIRKRALKSVYAFAICGQQNGIIAKIELGNHFHANYAHDGDSILPGMRIASMG